MKIEELTTDSFQQKVANLNNDPSMWDYFGDKPCIVVFYTDWCSPCKSLISRLSEIAETYDDLFYIYKVNIAIEKRIAANLNIRTVPSMLYCPMNQEPQTAFGLVPREKIVEIIEDVLLV